MRALEFITGHVIYNPAYTYKFQLKTTMYHNCHVFHEHLYFSGDKSQLYLICVACDID